MPRVYYIYAKSAAPAIRAPLRHTLSAARYAGHYYATLLRAYTPLLIRGVRRRCFDAIRLRQPLIRRFDSR